MNLVLGSLPEGLLWGLFGGSAGLVIYTYLGYPLLLLVLRQLRSASRPEPIAEENLPGVTMILSAYDEATVIAEKVANFLAIDYPNGQLHLLLGSDGSSDRTAAIARESAGGDPRVEIIDFEENRGKVNVLNDLMERVESPIVVLSDANTLYAPDAVSHLVAHFTDPRVGGVCARLVLTDEETGGCREEGLYWRYETWIKRAESDLGTLSSINGQAFAFRRELYEPLPPDAITEDQHLGLLILGRGYRIRFEPEAVVTEPIGNLAVERGRRLRISAGNFQTLFRAGLPLVNPLRGFASFAYVSHKVMRWFVPPLLLLALATNALLWTHPLAQILLTIQVLFYLSAGCPALLPATGRLRPIGLTHYFVVMNWTIVCGFWRYLLGRQQVAWDRTARS